MQGLLEDKSTGLLYRKWGEAPSDTTLILVHGMGAHTGRWDSLAEFMLSNGMSSYALELEGFGDSPALKGHIDSFRIYYDHIARLRDIVLEKKPYARIFLVSESMGGLISFMFAGLYPEKLDGLVCLSPAFQSIMKLSLMAYFNIFTSAFSSPEKQFEMPFDAVMCTRDEEVRDRMDKDAREHRMASAGLLFEIAKAQIKSLSLAAKISIPVLFLLAGEDSMISVPRAEQIYHRLKVDKKSIIIYPEMRHALSIELGREQVFEDIKEWINASGGEI